MAGLFDSGYFAPQSNAGGLIDRLLEQLAAQGQYTPGPVQTTSSGAALPRGAVIDAQDYAPQPAPALPSDQARYGNAPPSMQAMAAPQAPQPQPQPMQLPPAFGGGGIQNYLRNLHNGGGLITSAFDTP